MCTSPIKIKNRSKTCKDGVTRKYIMVPCGKCEDCRSNQSEQWFQRIYQEMNDCLNSGGRVIYGGAFTYNDINVPRFHYVGLEGEDKSFMCFNKHHKDKFVHDLRQYFQYKKVNVPDNGYSFKYIWCSEYGMAEGRTHRPHYHPLFFIPKEWMDYVGYDENSWKALLRRYWQDFPNNLGFVRWAPKSSIFVNSEFAGLYASKYICKDVGFYNQPEVMEYLEDMKVSLSDVKYLKVKSYLPRHWQSEYFGANLEKIYSNCEAYVNGVDFGLCSEVQHGKSVIHKCPMYIEKRMLYDINELGQMKLNMKGREFKKARFEQKLYKDAMKYIQYLDDDFVRHRLRDVNIGSSGDSRLDVFPDKVTLCNEIRRLFREHNAHSDEEMALQLYLYNRVWSGRWTFDHDKLSLLDNLNYHDFVNLSIDVYIDDLFVVDYDRFNAEGVFSDFDPVSSGAVYFDTCSRFVDFDYLLGLIGSIENLYRKKCHEHYLEDRMRRKENKLLLVS